MIKAKLSDKKLITNILYESFKHDSYFAWLLEKSNPLKLMSLFDYVVDEVFSIGEVFLNDEKTATFLLTSEKVEKFSLRSILRSINAIRKIGIRSAVRALKISHKIHQYYPKTKHYRLAFIAVMPSEQGKGTGSKLLNYLIERSEAEHIPIHLETESMTNVSIYKHKGFEVYDNFTISNHVTYFMKREPKSK